MFAVVDKWFFAKGSPVTLGVFRVVICSIAFINLAMIAIDFNDWFGENGYVPVEVGLRYSGDKLYAIGNAKEGLPILDLAQPLPRINLLSNVASTEWTAVFYVLTMAAALFAAVGLWTRIMTIALAIGMVTLHHRNLLILHGGDTALRQFLIIIAIAPSGAAVSLDRFIAVWKGKAPAIPEAITMWGQRLVQYQLALLYFTAVWYKWQGSHWRDGTATFYISQLREFNRFWVPEFMERQPVLSITTYGTLFTELALATLVFYKPFRKWVLLAGLAMHGYIEYRFNIPMFAFVVTSGYLCFYDGEETVAWAKRVGQRFKRAHLRILLPAGLRLAKDKGDAIKNMDPLNMVDYQQGDTSEWQAAAASGKKRDPFLASWQRSIGAWPLALIWRKLLIKAAEPIPSEPAQTKDKRQATAAKGGV